MDGGRVEPDLGPVETADEPFPQELFFDGKLCASDEGCASSGEALGPYRKWACVAGTCQQQDRANGTACDDGNACSLGDECATGECVGKPVECEEDEDPCTGP